MKEETVLNTYKPLVAGQNDEILNNLLKCNFDSNMRDESLDIDLSACISISTVNSCSEFFWKVLDDSAQNVDVSRASNGSVEEHDNIKNPASDLPPPSPRPLNVPDSGGGGAVPGSGNPVTANKKNRRKATVPKKAENEVEVKFEKNGTEEEADNFNMDRLENAGIRFKYKCEHCSILLNSLEEFYEHEASHKIQFKCNECEQEFDSESALKKHAKTHKTVPTAASGEKGVRKDAWQECPDCGKSLKLGSMWMHRKIHSDNKKYGCDICGQKFVQKINLTHHSKVHSGEKPFECDQCTKSFPEKSHLIRHQKYHTSTRPYRCEKCGKMYKTERCLKVHNLVHLEQRPFVCQVCNKSFISNSKLKQHSNIHTGERPYKCNYCSRDFTNFPNWLKHTRRRHKVDHKTGELLENIPNYCTKQKTSAPKTTTTKPAAAKAPPKPKESAQETKSTSTTTKKRKKSSPSATQKTKTTTSQGPSEPQPTKSSKIELNPLNDIHCLSLRSAEELIMEQALEMEESGLYMGRGDEDDNMHFDYQEHFDIKDFDDNKGNILCSLDSSPFSSPASIDLPTYTLPTLSSMSIIVPAPNATKPTSSLEPGSFHCLPASANSNQTLPSVDILLNATNFLKKENNIY